MTTLGRSAGSGDWGVIAPGTMALLPRGASALVVLPPHRVAPAGHLPRPKSTAVQECDDSTGFALSHCVGSSTTDQRSGGTPMRRRIPGSLLATVLLVLVACEGRDKPLAPSP